MTRNQIGSPAEVDPALVKFPSFSFAFFDQPDQRNVFGLLAAAFTFCHDYLTLHGVALMKDYLYSWLKYLRISKVYAFFGL